MMDATGSRSSQSTLSNYRLLNTIGRGAFSKVKLAIHIVTGCKVAIKICKRQSIHDLSSEKVSREINIMRLFTHPHIVRLYEVINTRSKIFIVMEHMTSGELFDYITENGRIKEDEARCFFQQIISGVECCHLMNVVHRDLKPENLLLDSNHNVKVADFGLSNIMRDGHFLKTCCGSPNYAAPEVISERLYAGPEVDVWSCGVILYALLCGTLPFDDDNLSGLYTKIKRGIYRPPNNLSLAAQDLIGRILIVDPIKRISIPEIRRHPWFQESLPQYIAMRTTVATYNTKKASVSSRLFFTRDHKAKFDEEIIQEVVKIGFNIEIVRDSLQKKLQNEATVAYFLLLDDRYRGNSSNLMIELLPKSQDEMDDRGVYLRSPPLVQRKWALGFQSRSTPHRTMAGVLRLLEALNVRWKKIGHYNMKCLWQSPFFTCSESISHIDHICCHELSTTSRNPLSLNSPKAVKFEIQLYKTDEDSYVLDMQRINGPTFLFLELCAAFNSLLVA